MAEVEGEEEEGEEVEAEVEAEAPQQEEQQPQEEEEMRNSLERNHQPSMEIGKTSTDSFRISKDTCR